jgi:hypothetical protein
MNGLKTIRFFVIFGLCLTLLGLKDSFKDLPFVFLYLAPCFSVIILYFITVKRKRLIMIFMSVQYLYSLIYLFPYYLDRVSWETAWLDIVIFIIMPTLLTAFYLISNLEHIFYQVNALVMITVPTLICVFFVSYRYQIKILNSNLIILPRESYYTDGLAYLVIYLSLFYVSTGISEFIIIKKHQNDVTLVK